MPKPVQNQKLKNCWIFFVLSAFPLVSQANVGDRRFVISHWPDGRLGPISTSLYQQQSNGLVESKNSLNLKTADCDTLLQHYQLFSLEAMLQRHLITQEEFDFYKSLPKDFDFRQISYFHSATEQTISSPPTHDWLGFDYAALAADSMADRQFADIVRSAYQFLKTDGSLWLVRGQLPKSDGKLSELFLPWLREGKFRNYFQVAAQDKMRWEVGRAAQSEQGIIHTLFHASVLQAAHEAVLFNVPLGAAAIYAHTPSQKLAEHYQDQYGLQILGKSDDGDYLLRANLEQLIRKFPPHQFHAIFARTLSATQLQNENAIAIHQTLHDGLRIFEANGNESLTAPILVVFDRFWGFVYQKSLRITNYENIIRFSELSFNKGWNKSLIPTSDLSCAAILPKNGAILVSQLSEQDSERFPFYLERVLASIWSSILVELSQPGIPVQFSQEFFDGTRNVEILTSSLNLKRKAELLGGVLIDAGIDYQEKTNFVLMDGKVQYQLEERNAYRIRFSVSVLQKLQRDFSDQKPFIAPGVSQQTRKMLNAF